MRRLSLRARALSTLVAIVAATTFFAPPGASALSGVHPLAVVLCKFTNLTAEPHAVSYYQDMFSESGAGKKGAFDYWKDVSYANLDLTGTVVKGWYTLPMTVEQWRMLGRADRIDKCASQALGAVDYTRFAGVVTLTNQRGLSEDLGGYGPGFPISGVNYPGLGAMISEEDQGLSNILHESGHAFGVNHSRALSRQTPTSTQPDYGDPYDVMSCAGCTGTPSYQGNGGPGFNAIQLDTAGWLPAGRRFSFDNSSCRQQTIQMAALNHPEAAGYQEARVPASIPINYRTPANPPFYATSSDYYTVELRARTGWDAGFAQDLALIHLHGVDGYSYWVDQNGLAGTYYQPGGTSGVAGSEYVDGPRNSFVAINAINTTNHTATVTLAACKIKVDVAYSGPTTGEFNTVVPLRADLAVRGSGAPVAFRTVNLSLGSQTCQALSDSGGHATCDIQINQHAGPVAAGASFAGDHAYEAAAVAGVPFTITKAPTKVAYTGPITADYHDTFRASGTFVDRFSRPVAAKELAFSLGAGDTCSASTSVNGASSCPITPTQPSGTYPMTVSFAGDLDYLASSDTRSFTVTKEETALTYDGPFQVANDAPATLTGTLKEDAVTPIAGRNVTFGLGSGATAQGCQGVTDATGRASCTIASVAQPGSAAMTLPVSARFDTDRYYLASGASGTARLQFYTGGSFGAFTNLLGLLSSTAADTGSIRTAARSDTRRSSLSASVLFVTLDAPRAGVTTGNGTSSASASLASLRIGLPGLPVVQAAGVTASSVSTCAGTTGASMIQSLRVGAITVPVANARPNTALSLAGISIVLNEQSPAPGADHGLVVNAIHITLPGGTEVIASSARSDIHNCP